MLLEIVVSMQRKAERVVRQRSKIKVLDTNAVPQVQSCVCCISIGDAWLCLEMMAKLYIRLSQSK